MTEVQAGVVKIKKDMTTWGCEAFSIENVDGNGESVMFWVEDWGDLLEAIEKMRPYMEGEDGAVE